MIDKIDDYRQSVLQHGSGNDRVYLMKVDPQDCPGVISYALKLARANDYSKIFAKVPDSCRHFFEQEGFLAEASIPELFNGEEAGYFYSKFLKDERHREQKPDTVKNVLVAAENKQAEEPPGFEPDDDFSWRIMTRDDVEPMAELYRQVFASYPFPIDDPCYLAETMDQNLVYHGILNDNELVALSSAEIDFAGRNAEMTDFATRPDCRGQGLATYLLEKMERDVTESGIRTSYTIARAYSFGMNITFAKHGYRYAGTLVNNTQIFGQLESMNVWHKQL